MVGEIVTQDLRAPWFCHQPDLRRVCENSANAVIGG